MDEVFSYWDQMEEMADAEAGSAMEAAPPHTPSRSPAPKAMCSVVGVFGSASDLQSISFWISNESITINYADPQGIQILGVFGSLENALTNLRGPHSMLMGHPELDRLWDQAGIYDVTSNVDHDWSDLAEGITVHTGGIELWDLFRTQTQQSTLHPSEGEEAADATGETNAASAESGTPSDSSTAIATCKSVPTRMFAYVTQTPRLRVV